MGNSYENYYKTEPVSTASKKTTTAMMITMKMMTAENDYQPQMKQ